MHIKRIFIRTLFISIQWIMALTIFPYLSRFHIKVFLTCPDIQIVAIIRRTQFINISLSWSIFLCEILNLRINPRLYSGHLVSHVGDTIGDILPVVIQEHSRGTQIYQWRKPVVGNAHYSRIIREDERLHHRGILIGAIIPLRPQDSLLYLGVRIRT